MNEVWEVKIEGYSSFQIPQKLNILKHKLRNLYGKDQLQKHLSKVESDLAAIQNQLHDHPNSSTLATKVQQISHQIGLIKRDMESSLRKKKLKFIIGSSLVMIMPSSFIRS